VASLVCGWFIPAAVLRFALRSLRESPKAQASNYAGRTVVYGLGIAWLVWALMVPFLPLVYGAVRIPAGFVGGRAENPLAWPALVLVASLLAFVCFCFGLIDDSYGARGAGGFRGHLKALFTGHLTTGALKLFGMSLASLMAGIFVSLLREGRSDLSSACTHLSVLSFLVPLLLGASIALTANFVNLTDLRPARASKVFLVLVVLGGIVNLCMTGFQNVILSALTLVVLLGPLLATWRYDAGEVAMLGDAGANPMGAVAGLYFTWNLPWWGLVLYVTVMLALNLLSEKVSFSAAIDRTPVLRFLDGLGRKKP
jgi:hypothetical protein